ncbi:GNAT family N-acetyltransferase [Flavobacterium sp. F372]|uniref:GNAT family N-acetyltransferase n=1 Tax=Flavobacterium bernardetii TaxID=2813823 RepID=A0ABR7J1B6_9FLAO|nr:GNAT family N-acetyltransferase [Flavobacterium bernardetii]MBC5835866.1 GNAT family N-acetyltransferase [Flavobacterium bernardetii]NHF69596.1 GNAT family N-acetyltransferase [Flavobacterium bernardetii]
MQLIRTNSDNPDFKILSALFDDYLVDIDGEEKDFFAFYNNVQLDTVLVVYENSEVVGCGAFKKFDDTTAEIKRMFVHPNHRNKGIAKFVLNELELWANDLGFTSFILETSPKLTSAIALYEKTGYQLIPNYGQYIGVENSICMKKG